MQTGKLSQDSDFTAFPLANKKDWGRDLGGFPFQKWEVRILF